MLKNMSPREEQKTIINKAVNYFNQNDKGMLILICGAGKTLISLWITKSLNSNTIVIGVPNRLLLKQWKEIVNILFKNVPILIVSGGIKNNDIVDFLRINKNKCIVITTYSSSYKVYNASQEINIIFDMKILDEVHHLTTDNMNATGSNKKFIQMLNIRSKKQLSLTATLKQIENDCDENNNTIISNDDIKYFGEIIDRKNLLWGIQLNIICDYVIQIVVIDENMINNMLFSSENDESYKSLKIAAFASLKSIFNKNSHHLLIYVNNDKYNMLNEVILYKRIALSSTAFRIASGTSLAFPVPIPTKPWPSPTTTRTEKLNRRPPFTTLATRLI